MPQDGRDSGLREYSIVEGLLFCVVALTSATELSPWERLFVVQMVGLPVHPGYLADVYLACGCFAEARLLYANPAHPRKLGDICWCEGDLEKAELHYMAAKSEAQTYRDSPDDDRLIKLAFYQEQWDKVVDRFSNAKFGNWNPPNEITLGKSVTKARPYLEILAMALHRSNSSNSTVVLGVLKRHFDMTEKQWHKYRLNPAHTDLKAIAKVKSRCRPRLGANPTLTLAEAVGLGNTSRAMDVITYIRLADEHLKTAKNAVGKFIETGEQAELDHFVRLATGSGIASISQTLLSSALPDEVLNDTADGSAERLVRLFSCNPVMGNMYFGRLLDLKFKNRLLITASDLLTGIFQVIARSEQVGSARSKATLDIPRLASCREWARIRLDEWLNAQGSYRVERVAELWREDKASPAPRPFVNGAVAVPDSPRTMNEWNDLVRDALGWLEQRWKREIGASPWVKENQLYQILRRLLKGKNVLQHARPTWLQPQHLDVYVPQAGIAVEYMGQQHFDSVEFLGGEAGLRLVIERDRRKLALCEAHGIRLIRVRFDEDLGIRAKEIANQVNSALSPHITSQSAWPELIPRHEAQI